VEQLRGRNALVTGAAGGLGGYIARALAAEGVNLVLSDLPEAEMGALLEEVSDKGVKAQQLGADISARSEAAGLVAQAEEALGPIDILVNNAGLEFAGPFLEKTPTEIEMLLQVNVAAVMLTTNAAVPGMLERGRGHVVNIASMAGKSGFPYLALYCGSKHAVVGFTHSMRAELGASPVGFTAICPGFISRVGMYGRFEDEVGQPPGPIAPLPPERVGDAVVKGVRDNKAEILVNSAGARGLIAIAALAPGISTKIGLRGPMRAFAERFSEARKHAEDTPAERRLADRD